MPPAPIQRALALAALGAAVAALGFETISVGARPAQSDPTSYLPNVVSGGYSPNLPAAAAMGGENGLAPQGIVGFGESTIELQSLASRPMSVRIELESTANFGNVAIADTVPAGGALARSLRATQGVTFSNYAATVDAEGPHAALARTSWDSGAEAVYESPVPSTDLVLPIVARDVYSHTTVIWMQNTDAEEETELDLELFNDSGALAASWTFRLGPGKAGRIDPLYQSEFDDLPQNAATGFLGSFRIHADAPVAVMAYGDEPQGRGAYALRARPVSEASETQYLPFVRAASNGHGLIAVANTANSAVEVTISYRGAPNSPVGAGQVVEQTLRIGPRSQAFVDLDSRLGRGSHPPPSLPRGGFVGSAIVRATGPVLAAVWDQALGTSLDPANGYPQVLASMAYNGFGPEDLSTVFSAPRVKNDPAGQTTELVLMNPGDAPTSVDIDLLAPDGTEAGPTGSVAVGPGDMRTWSVQLPSPGSAQARLRASAPFAGLAVDVSASADWTAYWPVRMPTDLVDIPTPTPPPTYTPTPTGVPATATATATGSVAPGNPARLFLPQAFRRR